MLGRDSITKQPVTVKAAFDVTADVCPSDRDGNVLLEYFICFRGPGVWVEYCYPGQEEGIGAGLLLSELKVDILRSGHHPDSRGINYERLYDLIRKLSLF